MRAGFGSILAAVFVIGAACSTQTGPAPSPTRSNHPNLPVPGSSGPTPGPTSAPTSSPTSTSGGLPLPAPTPLAHADVNHVLSTGQSNAVSTDGVPPLTTSQPYANLKFDVGLFTATACDGTGCGQYEKPSSFVPLVEGDSFWYPSETMSSGLANEVSRIALARGLDPAHAVLVSVHGRSGNTYWCLRKGSCDYQAGLGYLRAFDDDAMREVQDALAIAQASGKSYLVRAVTAIHGEADNVLHELPLPSTDGVGVVHDYGDALVEWQRDYEAGVKAITAQAVPVPLFVNQYSHWNDAPHSELPLLQLRAHVQSHGKVIVVGPTYALSYGPDCLHFTNQTERHLGEYFGKAYARVVLEGRTWEPLRPKAVTRAGNVITVSFVVPKPPLVFDTQRVTDPGDYGFEYADDSPSPPAIASVALAGPDSVTVTLASAPSGANRRIRYAYTYHGCPGPQAGARGNLRDSDDTPSEYGDDLSNWAVHFDEAVP